MQYVCPICQQQANMDTIACEECDDWFHFECLGLTYKNIKKIEEEAPIISVSVTITVLGTRKWTSCLGLKFISIDIEVFW
jgi:hypothetical protein